MMGSVHAMGFDLYEEVLSDIVSLVSVISGWVD